MYRNYKAEQKAKRMPVAKKSTYINIFNTKFNITLFQPKKNLCSFWETFKHSSPEEQPILGQNYEKHLKINKKPRTESKRRLKIENNNNTK